MMRTKSYRSSNALPAPAQRAPPLSHPSLASQSTPDRPSQPTCLRSQHNHNHHERATAKSKEKPYHVSYHAHQFTAQCVRGGGGRADRRRVREWIELMVVSSPRGGGIESLTYSYSSGYHHCGGHPTPRERKRGGGRMRGNTRRTGRRGQVPPTKRTLTCAARGTGGDRELHCDIATRGSNGCPDRYP